MTGLFVSVLQSLYMRSVQFYFISDSQGELGARPKGNPIDISQHSAPIKSKEIEDFANFPAIRAKGIPIEANARVARKKIFLLAFSELTIRPL